MCSKSINIETLKSIFFIYSQIDTLAAEYPAMTNYLYCTYHGRVSGPREHREETLFSVPLISIHPPWTF